MVLTFQSDSFDVDGTRLKPSRSGCSVLWGLVPLGDWPVACPQFFGKAGAIHSSAKRSEITVNRTLKALNPPATSTLTTEATSDLHEQIRRCAYELYEQRGREGGRELDDGCKQSPR